MLQLGRKSLEIRNAGKAGVLRELDNPKIDWKGH
jgi:hypothetical protein